MAFLVSVVAESLMAKFMLVKYGVAGFWVEYTYIYTWGFRFAFDWFHRLGGVEGGVASTSTSISL